MANADPDITEADGNKSANVERPKLTLPKGFADEQGFVAHMRKDFQDDMDADKLNRDAGVEDAEFAVGNQWERTIRQRRENKRKPVLTVNRLMAFIGQVVGTRRQNETQIHVLPDTQNKKNEAFIRAGLIRNIEKNTKAERAYDTALQNCVITGIGNFGISLDYARWDVFDQDINIVEYPDAFSTLWPRNIVDKTGRDANHVFQIESLKKEAYESRWPWATIASMELDPSFASSKSEGWFNGDDVRIVHYWRMCSEKIKLGLTTEGEVIEVSKKGDKVWAKRPGTNEDYIKEAECPYAEKYIMSGMNVLEGPYKLKYAYRVPVFRVPAWEIVIGPVRHRFGLVRFMKDPQRLHNYWRSTIAEKLMMAPRARWVASDAAVSGKEAQWRNAHLSDDPLLVWNADSGQPPVYTPPVQLEVALVQEANMSAQDLRDVSNLHEASLGQQSNEVSAKAINARTRIGDVGTFIYHDNVNSAIAEAGEFINAIIPLAYDTARTIRILDVAGKESFVRINDPDHENAPDITIGRYSISITTGPSTATRRIEAQEAMLAIFNAAPETAAPTMDLYVKTQDWPGAEQFVKRLQRLPTIAPFIDPEELDPKEQEEFKKRQAAMQQQQQQETAIKMKVLEVQLAEQTAKTAEAQAKANQANAEARHADQKAKAQEAQIELMRAQAVQARSAAFSNVTKAVAAGMEAQVDAVIAQIAAEVERDMPFPATEGGEPTIGAPAAPSAPPTTTPAPEPAQPAEPTGE